MTNVEALKTIYTALGGNSADVANLTIIPDVLSAIATQLTTAGVATNLLPTVTTTNNGQLLTVSAGKWTAANAPTELPAVTAENNGAVLKVVDGAWAIGTDLTE